MATESQLALRTQFFQQVRESSAFQGFTELILKQLKSICVPISRLSVAEFRAPSDFRELAQLTGRLAEVWTAQVKLDPDILDDKLANYVFFPLSQVLKRHKECPSVLIEAVLKVLTGLIKYGWKTKITRELSVQLFHLFTFILEGGVPGQEKERDVSEEVALEGYRALAALVAASGSSGDGFLSRIDDDIVPSLGHCISLILDGSRDGATPEIQLEALRALEALQNAVRDHAMLATFLPGTVSSLSSVLAPPASLKRQRKVITMGLKVLTLVLVKIFADIRTRSILKEDDRLEAHGSEPGKVLTPAWLRASAAQVKIALSSILKLRTHEFEAVRKALERLCVTLLDECHVSLNSCQAILVESAMIVDPGDAEKSLQDTSLVDLAIIYPELSAAIGTTMFNWTTGLPSLMQTGDEQIKQHALRSFINGLRIASSLQFESSTLDDSLAMALKDTVVALTINLKTPKVINDFEVDDNVWRNMALVKNDERQVHAPVMLGQEGQRATREELLFLLASLGPQDQQLKLASDMLGYVRDSEGVDQISSYWLAFQLIKSTMTSSTEVDSFVNLDFFTTDVHSQPSLFQELYDFSVSVIAAHSDAVETDWRLEAIALEVAAFAATRMQADFQPELIDVLYPVATFMGSQHPQLRSHAITTLNIIAAACSYGSVSDLIVDNADYMVNSVSLRLNTFDISPASTKVLAMMIRLTGPRLIPFLDDVVAAIFAALDNYHGYPVFVESLFAVLRELVEQGVKSDQLLLEGSEKKVTGHRKTAPKPTSVDDILEILDKRAEREKKQDGDDDPGVVKGHPKLPWTTTQPKDQPEEDSKSEQDQPPDESQPSPTPTYALLAQVATSTQHHLTSPSATLRKSLLDLLTTACPALAPDETAFLPLVHAVWPVVIARLRDPEPFVAVAAAGALAALCEAAGDFLASRVKAEWSRLRAWCVAVRDEAARAAGRRGGGGTAMGRAGGLVALSASMPGRGGGSYALGAGVSGGEIVLPSRSADAENRGVVSKDVSKVTPSSSGGGLGRFAQAAQLWEAAVGLLTAVVSFVRLDDDIFDQVLDLLADELDGNERACQALEAVNADAVWLAMYGRGWVPAMPVPRIEGVAFFGMEGRVQ